MNPSLLQFMPLLAGLLLAALQDLSSRRIANAITLPLLLAGLGLSVAGRGPVGCAQAFAGLGVGFALTFIPFAMGGLKGGDVKLLAAVGCWIGPWPTLCVFAVESVIGMFIVAAQAAIQGRLTVLVRNSALLALNLAHAGQLGFEHVVETGQSCRSVRKPLPYAVPVFLATLLVLLRLYPAQ